MTTESDVVLTHNLRTSIEASRVTEIELRFHAKRLLHRVARPSAPALVSNEAFDRLCRLGLARRTLLELGWEEVVRALDLELYALMGRNGEHDSFSEQERGHLLDLLCGYGSGVRYCRLLRRYQEGRIGGNTAPESDAFTASDRMLASSDEEV